MKKLFIILSLCVISLITNAECKSIEHIFLIHGVGGSPSSFSKMDINLRKHLRCVDTYYFSYETENSRLKVKDFSKSLERFIQSKNISAKDQISFIMHSQGGLVGLDWLYRSFKEFESYKESKISQFKNYITLSTPFWGSDFSSLGDSVLYSNDLVRNTVLPLGQEQLIDMKYGSETSLKRLESLTEDDNVSFVNFLKSIRVLNVKATVHVPDTSAIDRVSAILEGDLIVNIPSMELGFNYYKEEEINEYTTNMKSIVLGNILSSSVSHVRGAHTSGAMVPGVASVPWFCRFERFCYHEGYKAVLSFLRGQEPYTNPELDEELKSFELHVRVEIPTLENAEEDLTLEILSEEDPSLTVSYYRNDRTTYSPLRFNKEGKIAFFIVKGVVHNETSANLEIRISHPDVKSRSYKLSPSKRRVNHLMTSLKLLP